MFLKRYSISSDAAPSHPDLEVEQFALIHIAHP